MRIFEATTRMPDGTEILKFTNGYTFEGFTDAKHNPISGIVKTPKGEKYNIPTFEADFYTVFNLIEGNQLKKYKINKK